METKATVETATVPPEEPRTLERVRYEVWQMDAEVQRAWKRMTRANTPRNIASYYQWLAAQDTLWAEYWYKRADQEAD